LGPSEFGGDPIAIAGFSPLKTFVDVLFQWIDA
jgi:hypothetical protein